MIREWQTTHINNADSDPESPPGDGWRLIAVCPSYITEYGDDYGCSDYIRKVIALFWEREIEGDAG